MSANLLRPQWVNKNINSTKHNNGLVQERRNSVANAPEFFFHYPIVMISVVVATSHVNPCNVLRVSLLTARKCFSWFAALRLPLWWATICLPVAPPSARMRPRLPSPWAAGPARPPPPPPPPLRWTLRGRPPRHSMPHSLQPHRSRPRHPRQTITVSMPPTCRSRTQGLLLARYVGY